MHPSRSRAGIGEVGEVGVCVIVQGKGEILAIRYCVLYLRPSSMRTPFLGVRGRARVDRSS